MSTPFSTMRNRNDCLTRMRRRGVESRLVIEHERRGPRASGLDLVSGRPRSLVEIAKAEGVTRSDVGRQVPLAFLAPDIVESVLAGTQPVHVATELLTKRVDLPMAWKESASLLGFEWWPVLKAGGLRQSDAQAKPDRLNLAHRRSGKIRAGRSRRGLGGRLARHVPAHGHPARRPSLPQVALGEYPLVRPAEGPPAHPFRVVFIEVPVCAGAVR